MGALALSLAATPAIAAIGAPAGGTTPIATCIVRAAPGMTARTLFAPTAPFDCKTPQVALGSGDFWVRSAPIPRARAADPDLTVRFASTWQTSVALDILYADGAIRHTGFTSATSTTHLRLGAVFALRVPARASPPVRLLWHVRGAANLRGIVLGAMLSDRDVDDRTDTLMAALYGIFAGTAIALMVYNLALWGALRQAFQPAYCALVLCLLCYALASSNVIGEIIPALDNNDRLRISQLTLVASAIGVLVFARTFFETRIFHGVLARTSEAVMAALALAVIAYVTCPVGWMRSVDLVLSVAYAALVALVGPILWRAWRLQSSYTGLFALAWGLPVGFAGLRIANGFGLVGWSAWLDHSTLLSMMAEALLSSLAIAYRIKLLSRERDEAREQEIAARMLADTDPLTGLLNRRAFLARAIERVGDQILLIADLDHFKAVNETIGHDGGDEVLRIVARALRAAVPADALVARIGGEEFAIVADADAGPIASDVLARLRAERMPFDLRVTASIGSCTGPIAREADWNMLYREADRALFEAKAAGRDRARRGRRIAA